MILEVLTNPVAWFVVLLMSGVGVLIHLGQYKIGERGEAAVLEIVGEASYDKLQKAKDLIHRRGAPALLLTAIPGVASVLAFTAGLAKLQIASFVIFVFIAKLARNWLILLSAAGVFNIFKAI
jgi:membrane protein YqaA with SNARE-associated domain